MRTLRFRGLLALALLSACRQPMPEVAPAAALGSPVRTFSDCAFCPTMVEIPAGKTIVGADLVEHTAENLPEEYAARERPRREVAVAAFALAVHETTVGEYRRFVEATSYPTLEGCTTFDGRDVVLFQGSWRDPGYPTSDEHPVVCVSWDDAQAYSVWLSEISGESYRLPSEVEWEHAARAARGDARYFEGGHASLCVHANGADLAHGRWFPDYPWFNAECDDGEVFPTVVALRPPNPWGLYDIFGNVSEWVADCWTPDHSGPITQHARSEGDCALRVLRGGAALDMPQTLRAAWRTKGRHDERDAYDGFRVVRAL